MVPVLFLPVCVCVFVMGMSMSEYRDFGRPEEAIVLELEFSFKPLMWVLGTNVLGSSARTLCALNTPAPPYGLELLVLQSLLSKC